MEPENNQPTKLAGLVTVNKMVATEPFPTNSVKIQERKGFAGIEQKVGLTPLRLVATPKSERLPDWLAPGDIVWVKGDLCAAAFAKEVLELEGEKFVLIPDDRVIAYTHRHHFELGRVMVTTNASVAGDI
jgi:hypothetical protein